MSLTLCATGYVENLHIGYGGFAYFRKELAKAYSEKHGKMYESMVSSFGKSVNDDFIKEWNKDNSEGLDLLLWHSDCGGKLTPKECGLIYDELLKITPTFSDDFYTEFYDNLLDILKHCRKRRVMLFFY